MNLIRIIFWFLDVLSLNQLCFKCWNKVWKVLFEYLLFYFMILWFYFKVKVAAVHRVIVHVIILALKFCENIFELSFYLAFLKAFAGVSSPFLDRIRLIRAKKQIERKFDVKSTCVTFLTALNRRWNGG